MFEYNGLASSFFEFLQHEDCNLNCEEEACCRYIEIVTILPAKWRGLRGLVNNAGVGLFTDLLEGDSVESGCGGNLTPVCSYNHVM